jgi:ParB family transcriptional regulator, chromosome partitioning protein
MGARARKPRKKPADAGSRGLLPDQIADAPDDAKALAKLLLADGATPLAAFADPLNGRGLVLAALPIDKVVRTSFQRDLSDAHTKRLTEAIDRVGLFLDPIVALRSDDGLYHTPNGGHRLESMKRLGAKSITAIVVADPAVAFRILALNTEKAHNLKEKALEVIRMARAIPADRKESDLGLEFEEPALLTLGVCYEANARFSGGGYRSPLKRAEAFLDQPLADALAVREARGKALLAVDARVTEVMAALKAKGIDSPYLRGFVVARINPVRFAKEVTISPEELIAKLQANADKFNVDKVKDEDVKAAGGTPDDEG